MTSLSLWKNCESNVRTEDAILWGQRSVVGPMRLNRLKRGKRTFILAT